MNFWTLMDTRERTAFIVAAALVLTVVGYWTVQIDGALEMLRLARGG
jgi:hypothetical protein